jgi:DNA-binding beta-propeller fold protein YncE
MQKKHIITLITGLFLCIFFEMALADEFQAQQMTGIFKYPSDIVVIPNQNKAYVSSQTNGVISIVDLSLSPPGVTNQILVQSSGEIKLIKLAYNKAYQEVYALDWANSRLFIIDTTHDKLLDSPIIVGGYPQNLMVSDDGQTIYVCANQKDEIVLIDRASKNITQRIYIGEDADPYGMVLIGNKLYVTGRFSNKVHIIDLDKQLEVNRIKVTQSPFDIIARADEKYLYVSHDTSMGEISIIDSQTDTYVSSIQLGNAQETSKNPKEMLILENQLIVVNFGDQRLSLIDTDLNQQIDFCHPLFTGASYPEQLAISDNHKQLYIVHPFSDQVTVLSLPPPKPMFTKGADIQVKNCDNTQLIRNWATSIQAGMNATWKFQCETNNEVFFSQLPEISTDGSLSFTPSITAEGQARVEVKLIRNTAEIPDVCNISDPQTFYIHITTCDPTVFLSKTGNGEIVINDATRVLPPYNQQFPKNENVKFEARPYNDQWLFSHWLIDNAPSQTKNPLVIDIQEDINLKAIFVENEPIQLHIDGNCLVSVNGTSHTLPWENLFTPGNAVTLAVSDNFSHWTGDISGLENPIFFKIDTQMQINAHCNTDDSRQYYLKKGFNLVALSVVPENNVILKNFPQAEAAYEYKNGEYIRAYTMEPGKGYWICMPSTRTIEIIGHQYTSHQVHLKGGWQLIGGIYQTSKIQTLPENCVKTIYGYAEGAYQNVDEILPGKGYWIFLEKDCDVLIQ